MRSPQSENTVWWRGELLLFPSPAHHHGTPGLPLWSWGHAGCLGLILVDRGEKRKLKLIPSPTNPTPRVFILLYFIIFICHDVVSNRQ